ncbi:hypothetical protein KM1_291540 [Entamoeba histolytica HM-3:IMSS]|uniref:Akirin n=8 Tax=Entamoeba TaxID=5758 RepID=C4LUD1_ENTH1|nr:hypothetical protein ENU1_097600 [Entamoeba nuttalli P19]XP_655854.1 hypothetical protein EHI_049290 [Entamoeba histolytica HM-1:IMSS]EMD43327.1 Hypothetical protein EHI5A_111590 [Entamoeba histolytica KU27]EMS12279.1 hypothetical protein KM1_291540 [Entamoeba histolytica HM-3:IMSS]GAT92215.1 hypothetical protein CL6EHI_049290 [Entamoeba histolytica]EAL50473.1 hypothetical protein EHI_049290 [Entamoeba histolytica HM-1:IMSS]EKE40230.1 hypothetical protein ENU1_097600 [Entamoeba nuttalli P1|eukprot:XP_008857435.1 hypothetical protein ENU1_097600 [Entamoeba nuttalli P19]
MAFSLTKRPLLDPTNDLIVNENQISYQSKRPIKSENSSFKRSSPCPRVEVSVEELIRMSGKTSFTAEETQGIVLTAIRINEQRIREEYENILNNKLKEQFQAFTSTQRYYLAKQYGESDVPYYL